MSSVQMLVAVHVEVFIIRFSYLELVIFYNFITDSFDKAQQYLPAYPIADHFSLHCPELLELAAGLTMLVSQPVLAFRPYQPSFSLMY
jgi:hypothetical protein